MNRAITREPSETALSGSERKSLRRCERTIEKNLRSFIEVGNALAEIRDQRLYRAEFGRFEDYCQERWGMDRRYANRLVQASKTATDLGPMGPKPTTERQARELSRAPKEQRAKIMERATKKTNGKPTAAAIRREAEAFSAPEDTDADDETTWSDSEISFAASALTKSLRATIDNWQANIEAATEVDVCALLRELAEEYREES